MSLGRPLTVTAPGLHATTYTYDGDGNVLTVKDARGTTTTNHYNVGDQLTAASAFASLFLR